ncbi:GNAT family N-acetyltransferase [Vibrio gazogenes]|uniref:Protein N-acetyltransferase, RimJ/RimL family n=1 Tax=Vibrio gazogenes DSM 21264 = NBRC 103151 TaxID=1123492 RepID=A0A1M4TGP1_VIBGA|nr:GNAT family protein [Vibrio gazogenes]USP16091.1 GNAT family N-acetyltransferase [Vibrio gazogenes]SHE43588.1 Protein N-acetyltransferase, RimJ/RimL family [Vibrio gazogenes DSM 21264] [Vibrio gazogenes DSM 21264 = NBRC 103151]SJN54227.1 hypothetical protein BQ6471_00891 [Vibrio gazogenes]
MQLGDPRQASHILRCALLKHYNEREFGKYYDWIQYNYINTKETTYLNNGSAGEITLTLLEPLHIDAYRWAYTKQSDANKSVATLCNLPDFHNDGDWLSWLHDCRHYPNHYLYAVIHQEWGFIGSVCLEVFNGTGFFYYWLGEDFQGYGLGPQAVTLLLNIGEQQKGMRCCYAKVYDHNLPSQKALTKIGFTALPIQVSSAANNEKW